MGEPYKCIDGNELGHPGGSWFVSSAVSMIYLCALFFSLLAFITSCDGTTSAVALPQQSEEVESCSPEEEGTGKCAWWGDEYFVCRGGRWIKSWEAGDPCPSEGTKLCGYRCERRCDGEGQCPLLWTFISENCIGCVVENVNKSVEAESAFVDVVRGTMIDPRDGQTYKTVTIGSQTWMAENLNYQDERLSIEESLPSELFTFTNLPASGKLYTWDDAVNGDGLLSFDFNGCQANPGSCRVPDNWRGICPEGWHIPSRSEWNELLFVVTGGRYDRKSARISDRYIKVLRSTSGWETTSYVDHATFETYNINGTDLYGFSIYPSFICSDEICRAMYNRASFWLPSVTTCTFYMCPVILEINVSGLLVAMDRVEDDGGNYEGATFRAIGDYDYSSVRCVKDENVDASSNTSSSSIVSSSSNVSSSSIVHEIGTMTDSRDGQVYKTVTIGTQTWMAENLNYRYLGPTEDLDSSSFCYGGYAPSCDAYGRLYLWSAATDSAGIIEGNKANGYGEGSESTPGETVQGVCPTGWRLPSRAEWEKLIVFVDSYITEYEEDNRAGDKLKSSSDWPTGGWGEDLYSFSVLAAGFTRSDCLSKCFRSEGDAAFFWSSTESDNNRVYVVGFGSSNNDAVLREDPKFMAYSVRCIKDAE